jgi:hypothetical protein
VKTTTIKDDIVPLLLRHLSFIKTLWKAKGQRQVMMSIRLHELVPLVYSEDDMIWRESFFRTTRFKHPDYDHEDKTMMYPVERKQHPLDPLVQNLSDGIFKLVS